MINIISFSLKVLCCLCWCRCQRSRAHATLSRETSHRRGVAGRLGHPGCISRGRFLLHYISPNEDGDNLASSEAERSVVEGLKELGDLARVAADADPHRVIGGEDIIEDILASL